LSLICIVCCSPQLVDSTERLVVYSYSVSCSKLHYNCGLMILCKGISQRVGLALTEGP
jgi:hypothetical protein